MAEALAAAGAAVMIGDILEERADDGGEARGVRGQAGFVTLDVTTRRLGRAVAKMVAEFGGFDILVNNAGDRDLGARRGS